MDTEEETRIAVRAWLDNNHATLVGKFFDVSSREGAKGFEDWFVALSSQIEEFYPKKR